MLCFTVLPVFACKEIVMSSRGKVGDAVREQTKPLRASDVKFFEEVAQGRGRCPALVLKTVDKNMDVLSGTLKSLFALSEAYPDLKANQNFLGLQEELSSTENRIGFARQHYNDVVSQYNTALMRFPSNILAGMFGFLVLGHRPHTIV